MTPPQGPQGNPRRPLTGAAAGAPRVDGLDALLREIDSLRSTLETDLSLAAGALESGATDLAASLLATDRTELAAFEARALGHLRQLEAADRAAAGRSHDDVVVPFVPRAAQARRRRRLARLLPAAPLVAAAAALGVFLGVVPGGSGRPSGPDVSGAVLSSWAELNRLTEQDAPPEDVQRAAEALNADIAEMIARADGDPGAARDALALLREAQIVLSGDDDAAQLVGVLRESRALAARLLASLPPSVRPSLPASLRPVAPTPLPRPTLVRPSAAPRPAAPAPTASPASSASARPAPARSPESTRSGQAPTGASSPTPTPGRADPAPPRLPVPLGTTSF